MSNLFLLEISYGRIATDICSVPTCGKPRTVLEFEMVPDHIPFWKKSGAFPFWWSLISIFASLVLKSSPFKNSIVITKGLG